MLQDESTRVLYRDLLYGDLADPERVTAPMLVLGADLDGFFSRRQLRATARAYRTEAQLFPAMGHNMMLESGWRGGRRTHRRVADQPRAVTLRCNNGLRTSDRSDVMSVCRAAARIGGRTASKGWTLASST